MIQEYSYAFCAVCPLQAESYSLISPVCNTAAMNELLRGLSETYMEEQILLFADSAGWHQSKELNRPANIHLELLPPYSPELWVPASTSGIISGSKRASITTSLIRWMNGKII